MRVPGRTREEVRSSETRGAQEGVMRVPGRTREEESEGSREAQVDSRLVQGSGSQGSWVRGEGEEVEGVMGEVEGVMGEVEGAEGGVDVLLLLSWATKGSGGP